jgi:hypothetical protein
MKGKPMQIVFWGTVFGLFCAFVVGVVVAYGKFVQDKRSGIRADETLTTGKNTFEGVTYLNHKADTSLLEIQGLKREITTLNTQLMPFKELAKSRYPGLGEEAGLDKLQEHIVELENKTAKLENRASELETKARPRTLTTNQTNLLQTQLKNYKVPIFITSKFMDNESFQFAEQIFDAIRKINNNVFLSKTKTTIVDFSGVGITSFPPGAYSKEEEVLLNAFKNSSIPTKLINLPSNKMGEEPNMNCLLVVVGDK